MMKLPRCEPTSCPASLPNQFISFWFVLQPVERFLDRAFHVITEFSGFVLCKSFQTHSPVILHNERFIILFLPNGDLAPPQKKDNQAYRPGNDTLRNIPTNFDLLLTGQHEQIWHWIFRSTSLCLSESVRNQISWQESLRASFCFQLCGFQFGFLPFQVIHS
jgi:hypothetical protein